VNTSPSPVSTNPLNSIDVLSRIESQSSSYRNSVNSEVSSADFLYKTALEGLTESECFTPQGSEAQSPRRNYDLMARTMDKENTETNTTENILKSSGDTYVIEEIENNLSNTSINLPTPCASQEFIRENVEITHTAYETMKLRIFASETKTQELENRLKVQTNELELYKLQCSQLQDKLLVAEHEAEKMRSLEELNKLNSKTKFLMESVAMMSPVATDLELKKSVTFNQISLTPEIIDSRFPVSTPVRKGRKPENPKPETPRYDNSNPASVRAKLLKKNHLKKSNDEPQLKDTPQKSTPQLQKNTPLKSTPQKIKPQKSTPQKSTPHKIFNSKPDNLQDSLTVECEEANAALNSLKQKFSERRNLATPETSNELVKTPTLTFDSTGSSGDISTSRRTLNNMQSLSDQMKSIRLEQTPVRAMPSKVGVAEKEESENPEPEKLESENQESENRESENRESKNQESENHEPETKETQESDQEHEISCKLDYTELKNFENIVDDELNLEAVKIDPVELPKIASPPIISTSPETDSTPAIQQSKSPRIEQTSLEKKIKRISIANQTSQEKEVLERKKSEFLKQQEKKRAASKNNPTTPKKLRSKAGQHTSILNATTNTSVQNIKNNSVFPSNNGDSPMVMRPVRHKTNSTTNLSTVTSPSVVTQDRRDRGKAVLDKQKQRIEDTVNPAPQKSRPTTTNSTSRSALQSANSSRLASARSRKEDIPRTGVKNINKNTSHDNKQQIILAIEKTCLPGAVNAKDRKLIMEPLHEKLQDKEVSHLVILFRNAQLKFRSVYRLEPQDQENVDSERVQFTKISGQGPNKLTNTDVKCYYSYQTGRKIFNLINGKTFGFNVAGMTVEDRIWSNFKPKRTEVKK